MSETETENTSEPKSSQFSWRKLLKNFTTALLAISVGYIHYRYVSHLFENDKNFSYLSEMEREMSLHSEMGFYYSYYKTIIKETQFKTGFTKLMYDKLVEYPKDVNSVNRFNIHPEVVIGGIYRYFEPILNTTANRQCEVIIRGEGLSPVESCAGLGEPIMFYLEAVWLLAGLTVAALFLNAAALSESLFGGLFAVLQYFTNHADCTRVQWAPNQRENMAAPVLLLQAWLVSQQLRGRNDFVLQISMFSVNCLSLLFWQFSQFIFLTQIAILFVMEQLKILDLKCLCMLLHTHFCGLHIALLLLQGNEMLKSSLYTSFFSIVSVYCLLFSTLRVKVENRYDFIVESWLVLLRISIIVCASLYLKKVISGYYNVQDDSHIWDIFFAKFTNYKSFHTLLYLCSDVFDFFPMSSVKNLTRSMLIPLVIWILMNVCAYWISNAMNECKKDVGVMKDKSNGNDGENNILDGENNGIENAEEAIENRNNLDVIDQDVQSQNVDETIEKNEDSLICFFRKLTIEPALFYNISQMVVYGAMAALVMRLKLLFVPQMCIVSSLILNKTYFGLSKTYKKYAPLFWIVYMFPILQQLHLNVTKEMSYVGQYSDVNKEHLFQWIMNETSPSSAFAGSMPLMASVMLVTRRPIVAHPHYEHVEARERAYSVYKTYGRFTPEELYEELTKLKASYIIVEEKYCYGKSRKGCSFEDIWDVEYPDRRSQDTLCHVLLTKRVEHFYPVYRNMQYAVLKLHDYSVRFSPRTFNT